MAPWTPPPSEEAREAARPAGVEAWSPPRPPLPGRPTPPLDLPLPVLVLVEQARQASEAERPGLGSKLNAVLKEMAAAGGDRHVADTFHRLLESGSLEELVDEEGRSCRAVAVEALMSLGFPYALEVRPEDLAHLRAAGSRRRKRRGGGQYGPAVPGTVLASGVAAQLLQELLGRGRLGGPVTLQAGLALMALMALWLARPGTPVYRLGLGLLALVSGFALVLPLVSRGTDGLWLGMAGGVAVLLAALRES